MLIVDGVFAFRPQINDHWDLRIWLLVDPELSIQRGIARDQHHEGSEAEALHRYRYLPAERLYLAEVDPATLADIVIDNSAFDHPRSVKVPVVLPRRDGADRVVVLGHRLRPVGWRSLGWSLACRRYEEALRISGDLRQT